MKYRDSKVVKPLSVNYFGVAQLGGSVCTSGFEKSGHLVIRFVMETASILFYNTKKTIKTKQ